MKILLAVDGSKPSLDAVDLVIRTFGQLRARPEVELVTVHLPVPKLPRMGMAVGKGQIDKYYREEGEARRATSRAALPSSPLSLIHI